MRLSPQQTSHQNHGLPRVGQWGSSATFWLMGSKSHKGGEQYISNFLLWQAAYVEMYFTDVLWPDFNHQQHKLSLKWYANRIRRFSKTSEQINTAESKA